MQAVGVMMSAGLLATAVITATTAIRPPAVLPATAAAAAVAAAPLRVAAVAVHRYGSFNLSSYSGLVKRITHPVAPGFFVPAGTNPFPV